MAGRVLRLKGDEVKSELKLFRDTLGQSYGPLGRCVTMQYIMIFVINVILICGQH